LVKSAATEGRPDLTRGFATRQIKNQKQNAKK